MWISAGVKVLLLRKCCLKTDVVETGLIRSPVAQTQKEHPPHSLHHSSVNSPAERPFPQAVVLCLWVS